jgi:glycosyltransferase involved in cell wall biosynthesis
MTEPLGRSQVLPYLRGLARAGVGLTLLSFEAARASTETIEELRESLAQDGIEYRPLRRSPAHDLATKVRESSEALLRGLASALINRPRIVHARSYLPAAAADVVAMVSPGAKLLFDCRGMLGDEYVDNGQWTRDRLEFKLLKRFERRVFARAEGVVVLTKALESWLRKRDAFGSRTHVEVIPCCVDAKRFFPDRATRDEARADLGLNDRLALVYSGSLGSWYLEDEMARFAARLRDATAADGRRVAVVVLSHSPSERFIARLRDQGFGSEDVIVRNVPPVAMPKLLRAGDVGMSFIQSCFSKKGSSPTKVAEYLASGLVVVLNGDIGDQSELAAASDACVVLGSYADEDLRSAAVRAATLSRDPYEVRAGRSSTVARSHFDLEAIGIARYRRLYASLA